MINNFQLTENFNLQEFECNHCNSVKLSSTLVTLLQALRDELRRPIVITSGYRCTLHNRAVGGAERSMHLLGMAVDIAIGPTGLSMDRLADLAESIGFTGIGTNPKKGFIHLDVRPSKDVVRFTY